MSLTPYLRFPLGSHISGISGMNFELIDAAFGSLIPTSTATLSGGTVSVSNSTTPTTPVSRVVYSMKTPSATCTGASCTTSGTQLTLTVAPTVGALAIGSAISCTGSAAGNYIASYNAGTGTGPNTISAVYTLNAAVTTNEGTAVSLTGSIGSATGGSASFSGNTMTITVAPTAGYFAVGQYINAVFVPTGTTIVSLVSGVSGALGSVYTLSNQVIGNSVPPVIAAESFTTYNVPGVLSAALTPNTSIVFSSTNSGETSVINYQVVTPFSTALEPSIIQNPSQDTQVITVTKTNY